MIHVRFDMIDFEMTMDGHAEAPREGEFDLVCCAASVLGQQLIYSLEAFWKRQAMSIDRIDREMEPGHLRVRVRPMEWARASVMDRFRYCQEGMQMLQEKYPEYIEIEEA